jgi:putative FmdB family regulatory protein
VPIYEYQCIKCKNVEEVIQRISDEPKLHCSKCTGDLRKLISQSTFQLKGSGWYVTDYAKGKQSAHNSSKKISDSSKEQKHKTEKIQKKKVKED